MCDLANKQTLHNIRQIQGPGGRQQAFVILRGFSREKRQHTHTSGNNKAEYFTCTQQVRIQTESENFKDREIFKVRKIGFHTAEIHAKLCLLIPNSFFREVLLL